MRRSILIAALPIAIGSGALAARSEPATKFDGTWSVDVYPKQPDCQKYALRVELGGGKIKELKLRMDFGGASDRRRGPPRRRGGNAHARTGGHIGQRGAQRQFGIGALELADPPLLGRMAGQTIPIVVRPPLPLRTPLMPREARPAFGSDPGSPRCNRARR
jgi:hypothetical protein